MAETTATTSEVTVKEKEPLFGKAEKKLLLDPLGDTNPITIQVLGICSALAVTSLVYPSVVMAIAVVFVTGFSSLFTSLVRNKIPKQVRMIVQLVIIATLVTIVELTLKRFNYPIYKQLSVYIGLIITNCIVMGRLEAYAMANRPWRAFVDGLGNGVGYGVILIMVAVIREIFGKGTLFAGSPIQINLIGASNDEVGYLINTAAESGIGSFFAGYYNNNLMVLPAAAMFIIGVFIWIQRSYRPTLVDVS